ncbi:MAG: ATP-binding protein [Candidatus Nitrotoga sp.]|nr:ATP-binding protein [Candidatus Nitrotoga sp.]MDO9447252.1 ATP-binding protein [Candidatus Nitrotoga sp.]MDP1637681.1 ATP-binding protein [Candidatus Nitrotoga sp.]MDP1855798.1 ATP-binding protein [Candidatus Nitrotoga sp.]MDP3497470.1 ATP-binding protein [Candidatus Nitrotoga sp.]
MSTTTPFEDCKNAPLQNTSFVQGHGALVGIDVHSQLICVCTENSSEIFGQSSDKLLGQPASQIFGKHWPQLARLTSLESRHQVGEIASSEGQPITLIGHRQGDYLLLEIEHGAPKLPIWWNHSARTNFIEALAETKTIEQCVGLLVDTIFRHAGLDRVMCYRFLPGWHGEVIREACRPGLDGYMGLRFPASDVPANARQLYTLNWYRMIADVDAKNVPLVYWTNETTPVDMTYSILRGVHPVHIQYLHNMGVQASLSLSLVVNGRLWGLVACHHMTHLTLGIHERLALVEITKLVSLHLKNLLRLIDQQRQSNLREKLAVVRGALQATEESPRNGLVLNLGKLRDLFQANGVWLHFEGEEHFVGVTPDQQSLSPLRDWLDLLPKDQVSQYHQLPEIFAIHPAIVRNACGVLYIPLSTSDYLVLLRQEVVHVVNWAGQPPSLDENDRLPLTPRNSFATWAQVVRKSAEPWHGSEISCAETLRHELIYYIISLKNIKLNSEQSRRLLELQELNSKLEKAQNDLLQSEKMAAIGQLAAGVAHEINNPIGYVFSNLGTLEKYVQECFTMLDLYEQSESAIGDAEVRAIINAARDKLDIAFLKGDLRALMGESKDGITRVRNIVQNLKDFSHVDVADKWHFADLHKGIDSTLSIVSNKIQYKAVVVKEYGVIPEVECLSSQLNQVVMNLLVNASHAIEDNGTITICTGQQGDEVWVDIADTGKGITPEHMKKIFDPFFTTKSIGKGTGLGLSVSYGILQKHHGRFEVHSEVGKGTAFRFWLPIRQPGMSKHEFEEPRVTSCSENGDGYE